MPLVAALGTMLLLTLVAPVLARRFGRDAGYPLAVGFLGAGGLLAVHAPAVLRGEVVLQGWTWIPALGVRFALRFDGLAMLFTGLVLGVGALVMTYCARYLKPGTHPLTLYGLLCAFATAMLGLVLAGDVVTLFVCWELTTMCSFFLIGGQGEKGAQPATRALLVTAGGGLALLGAMALVVVATGTSDLSAVLAEPELLSSSPYAPAVAVLLLLAAFTKSAQLPFSFWLPGAMVALTPVSAYLHAATMVKAGIYLLLRFSPVYADNRGWTYVLLGVGLATALYGALLALKQHDLKALLAYSTISQLGFLVAATGVGTDEALGAVATHTFAHALFKATLFMLVGIIDREAGSRDIRELSGLRRAMPVTATLTAIAALSMAGVPPLLGFVSKESLFEAFLEAPGNTAGPAWVGPVAAGVAVLAAALTFAYGARIFVGAFTGPLLQRRLYEPAWSFLAPAAVPAAASVVLGVGVGVLDPLLSQVVRVVAPEVQVDYYLSLWHGWNAALVMSVLTIALGTVLYVLRDPVDRALQRREAPVNGVELFDRLYAATLRLGGLVGGPSMRGGVAAQLAPPLLLLLAAAGGVWIASGPISPTALSAGWSSPAGDWVVLGLLAPAIVAVAVVRSRLAAIALLGIIGFLVAVWFLLIGAPDLALTQVLVEILVVAVAVPVLRRLPRTFPQPRPVRATTAAVLALVGGLTVFGGVLALTGQRGLSPVGGWYLENAQAETGGTNVVNTVLVDFRGLDTLGEIVVLAVAAIGVGALLPAPQTATRTAPAIRSVLLDAAQRVVGPVALGLATYLFLRGHYQPGGGFIAGLVAGIAVVLQFLVHGPAGLRRIRVLRVPQLLTVGLALAVAVGLGGLLLDGAFLAGGSVYLPLPGGRLPLSSSLVFDVGVLLVVVALVLRSMEQLGAAGDAAGAATGPGPSASREPDTGTRPVPLETDDQAQVRS